MHQEVWTLALRAASLNRDGVTSQALLEVADKGRYHLLSRVTAGDQKIRSWAIFEVVGADSRNHERTSRKGRTGWRPSTIERATALDILTSSRVRNIRPALLTIARRESDPLRPKVLGELTRWADRFGPDDAVDLFLVRLLGTADARDQVPHPVNVVLDRVDSYDAPLGPRAQAALQKRIGVMMISGDWRKAAQSMRLSKGLSPEIRIPMLLDALNVWDQRAKSDRTYDGLVRTRFDLVRVLREVSGRKHGPEPRPWIDWWIAVQKGELPMPGSEEFKEVQRKRAEQPRTTAGFFGLRPETDRVTFIIDFSGSMETSWKTSEHSRFTEAVEQLMRFLHAAPKTTKFNIILFSGSPVRSSVGLVDATPNNLERARSSLLSRRPKGGTNLRPAVELALALDGRGIPQPEKIEADTIVVLCDGQTAEGGGWVKPMLDRVLPYHPVVFHSVVIGPNDDGALRNLAEESGGRFVQVGG